MPRVVCFFIAIAALLLASPEGYQVWMLDPSGFRRAHLSAESHLISARLVDDMDGESPAEALFLVNGQLSIRTDFQIRWSSPPQWVVRQAMIVDLNHDRQPEAVLLVSRPFQPWPVDEWLPNGGRIDTFQDTRGFSSHIILVGWDGRSFRELWAGSAMAEPAKQIEVAHTEDQGDLLVTLEGQYEDAAYLPARKVKFWEWNGFGFSLVSALDGKFRRMEIHEDRLAQYLVLFQ